MMLSAYAFCLNHVGKWQDLVARNLHLDYLYVAAHATVANVYLLVA